MDLLIDVLSTESLLQVKQPQSTAKQLPKDASNNLHARYLYEMECTGVLRTAGVVLRPNAGSQQMQT